MTTNLPSDPNATLEKLLDRNDIWRGDSYRPEPQKVLDTGYDDINAALSNGGWPKGNLVEVCLKGHQEWILFFPTLKMVTGYIVLLNPPAMPFGPAFIQAGIDLDRMIIVKTNNKADFLASFVELARTEACEILFAWQQHQSFSYNELRKCLLATNESAGLCVLFRPEREQQQNSPAILRLLTQNISNHIQLTIFKQKGALRQQPRLINLPLPEAWKGFPPYSLLDQTNLPTNSREVIKRKSAAVKPLRRNKK